MKLTITKNGQRLKALGEDLTSFQDNSCEVISLDDAVTAKNGLFNFFKEAYRVLNPGGILRIRSDNLKKNLSFKCEKLDPYEQFIELKNDWLDGQISESFLLRVLNLTGFLIVRRGDNHHLEAVKESQELKAQLPLVTIAIPAYKSEFYEFSLITAMGQSYLNFEVLIADEGVDGKIESITSNYLRRFPHIRVRYIKHSKPLGEVGNFEFCRANAKGVYLKYLDDDDVLDPDCVLRFVRAFEAFKDSVTLVSARRDPIDSFNNPVEHSTMSYYPLFQNLTYAHGKEIIELSLNQVANRIGEPTVFMFRRDDTDTHLTKFHDSEYPCSLDLVLAFKLLIKGNFIYIPETLSFYRVHVNQSSKEEKNFFHGHNVWANMILGFTKRYSLFSDKSEYVMGLQRVVNLLESYLKKRPETKYGQTLNESFAKLIKELENHKGFEPKEKVLKDFFSLEFN